MKNRVRYLATIGYFCKSTNSWKRFFEKVEEETGLKPVKTLNRTTRGGSGLIYLIEFQGEKYVAISDGGIGRGRYNVYTFYLFHLETFPILKEFFEKNKIKHHIY
jgi:8-oxo-dGTP pyrophosphatase MutT (NUDIX family)